MLKKWIGKFSHLVWMMCLSFFLGATFYAQASQPVKSPSIQSGQYELPEDLHWHHGLNEPLFASPKAKFGGVYYTYMSSFPQTFRTIGPDSNGSFRAWIGLASLSLLDKHPNTEHWLPSLASAWAYGTDHQTVYFKLNPKAKWSDGQPVTSHDFVFLLKLMRSPDIISPWYNDFYTKEIKDVIAYDDTTLAVIAAKPHSKDELLDYVNLQPRPAHFYKNPQIDENHDGIADDFVTRYNFKPEPVTGPYYIDKLIKGRKILFKHIGKSWWGYQIPYNQHRFNVAAISLKVIRDQDIALKYFEKGYIDSFVMIKPRLWHEKATGKLYQNGYIQKAWGYNQAPVGAGGIWINTAKPYLNDINVRKGLMYATDYDGMLKNILRGDYVRKPNPMGFGHGDYDDETIQPPHFDPKKAIGYFEKAGFTKIGPDGIRYKPRRGDKGKKINPRLSFEITYADQSQTPRIAYLREQAKKAGLELNLNLVDGSSMFKYVLEKKHELSFHDMGGGSIPGYWEYFHSDNANKSQTNNFTNYATPALDRLIEQYRNEFNSNAKKELSRQIQRQIADANVIIPGYMVPYAREAFWRWIKLPEQFMTKQTGFLFHGWGFAQTMSTFWIDETAKKETREALKDSKSFPEKVWLDDTYRIDSIEKNLKQATQEQEVIQ